MEIKNIIFDLGNVLIDLDLERTDRELERVLGKNFKDKLRDRGSEKVFEAFELGQISEAKFLSILSRASEKPVTELEIIAAWNAMLIGFEPIRFMLIETLESLGYQMFVLSNTNQIHLRWVYQRLQYKHRIKDFDQRFFIKTYYSHLIHLRKPSIDIYKFVLSDANLLASETLFIDDNADNIRGAAAAGLQTFLHPIGVEIGTTLPPLLGLR